MKNMNNLKLIDCDKKGNVVRLYFGDAKLNEWYGDDWDDRGCNDKVYNEYVAAYVDFAIGFDNDIYIPFDFYDLEEKVSKNGIKHHAYPMLIIGEDAYNYEDAMEKSKAVLWSGDSIETCLEKINALTVYTIKKEV